MRALTLLAFLTSGCQTFAVGNQAMRRLLPVEDRRQVAVPATRVTDGAPVFIRASRLEDLELDPPRQRALSTRFMGLQFLSGSLISTALTVVAAALLLGAANHAQLEMCSPLRGLLSSCTTYDGTVGLGVSGAVILGVGTLVNGWTQDEGARLQAVIVVDGDGDNVLRVLTTSGGRVLEQKLDSDWATDKLCTEALREIDRLYRDRAGERVPRDDP